MVSRWIDAAFGSQRLSYRRLLAWLVTCAFTLVGLIDSDGFVTLTVVYIGSDAAARAVGAWRGGAS